MTISTINNLEYIKMSYKKVGMLRSGLAIGGYSLAKYSGPKGIQVRLMRNGRSVARQSFTGNMEFLTWYSKLAPGDMGNHDAVAAMIADIKDKPTVIRGGAR